MNSFQILLLFVCLASSFSALTSLTRIQQATILDIHNAQRNGIAGGGYSYIGFPSSNNMKGLYWHDGLAACAQDWANHHTIEHNPNAQVPGLEGWIGENIFWASSESLDDPSYAVNSWFQEIDVCDPNIINSFGGGTDAAHFTQLVWAETVLVGCGISSGGGTFVVCNYYPGGNMMGSPVYTAGQPCTQCDCDPNWPNLCQ